jgi:PPK2 family polyphosphate:nucleotide phosphotransferase
LPGATLAQAAGSKQCEDDGVTDWFRVHPGKPAKLHERDPSSTEQAPGDRTVTEAAFAEQHAHLAALQDRLWAEHRRSLLIVLQGMDTSGKGGTIRHVFGGFNPSGTRVASFGRPAEIELAHDFLWRVHRETPRSGEVVIFDRSHYEDVLAARADQLVPEHVWRERYEHINHFESLLEHGCTKVLKFMLHISPEEQAARLQARLDDPDKRWKFRSSDLVERAKWDAYQEAFAEMLERTSTASAPWFVIPANHKWYRNWAVTHCLISELRDMGPKYPDVPLEGLGPTTIEPVE